MKSIVLIGFMGTGKSTVGKVLAEQLQIPFVDLDTVIVQQQHMEIDEIFAQFGEASFRKIEQEALQYAVHQENTILSPGGGAVLFAENRAMMRQNCYVISLTASAEIILDRVNQDKTVRPVLENRAPGQSKLERIIQLLDTRAMCYQDADFILDTSNRTIEDLVAQLINWINRQAGEKI